jgi:hypothetical protein
VNKRRVERLRELIAAICGQRHDVRVEVPHESDHVDYRLGCKSRHSSRAEVVYLSASEQRPDPLTLSRKAGWPRRVVLHDLDLGVPATGALEVFRCGASTIDPVHPRAVSHAARSYLVDAARVSYPAMHEVPVSTPKAILELNRLGR